MLGTLIEQRRAELDLSYANVSERAHRAGFRLSLQSVHQLTTQPITNLPRTETIRGLAHALELPEGAVALAALESAGVKVESSTGIDSFTESWVTLTSGRDDVQRGHLLRVARAAAEGLDLVIPRDEGSRLPAGTDTEDDPTRPDSSRGNSSARAVRGSEHGEAG